MTWAWNWGITTCSTWPEPVSAPTAPGPNLERKGDVMSENGTVLYAREHRRGLTLPQLNAVDLLAGGKNDTQTAELLNLSRTCVTKWRLYAPVFQAALNRRRAEVWGAALDRLRTLIPEALDVLAGGLKSTTASYRLRAAAEVLR